MNEFLMSWLLLPMLLVCCKIRCRSIGYDLIPTDMLDDDEREFDDACFVSDKLSINVCDAIDE